MQVRYSLLSSRRLTIMLPSLYDKVGENCDHRKALAADIADCLLLSSRLVAIRDKHYIDGTDSSSATSTSNKQV